MIRLGCAVMAGFVMAGPGLAEDVRLEVARDSVIGTYQAADGAGPAVLLLHGFTGTRDELAIEGTDDFVFTRFARALTAAGMPSLRIDFRGSGDSLEMPWEETTFSTQIEDAIAAIDWMAARPEIEGREIAVIGWSQGGLVAAFLAEARPELDGVVLLNPVTAPLDTYGGLFGPEVMAAGMEAAPTVPVSFSLPWGVEMELNGAFFHEIAESDPVGAISRYPGPALVIVGTEDDLVIPQPDMGQRVLDARSNTDDRLDLMEMDHVFNVFTGPETLDQVIAVTIPWLAGL
ncbi:alpha/beta hydrolase family protein [Rhodophyticola sp. CCM32]|uniref:alpha/beta hydrolase family protein n=1 Tax=Rhodophyticola sp. CCM32 TaxID=2916397 RepID=UPI00143D8DC8|nr:alpha/beta fold hydrolase [Rhodophyticola sp. CCM32]